MKSGGFDAIITNPPWEIWKPNAKEFFQRFSELVTKKKMTIKEFEKQQTELLKEPETASAWAAYLSGFPHVSSYFRAAPEYEHQISIVNGKKAGTDINLYKLFVERCFRLLKADGRCGLVIPSGIYTDLGAKQLRVMLFEEAQISGLFGFENRKMIFEGVDSRFKFVCLSFRKGGVTTSFPAAFMRHDVDELEEFPSRDSLQIEVETIQKLSPDSLSVMEFKSDLDLEIAQKMLRWPLLGQTIEGTWSIKLAREFDMTMDSYLFQTAPGPGRLPLFEGKMLHQFTHLWAEPKYWIEEDEAREKLISKKAGEDGGQTLDYQLPRLGYREIARNTDERTMISTVLPPNVFCNHKINWVSPSKSDSKFGNPETLFLCSIFNSFCFDYLIRQRGGSLSMFIIYQSPVPRLDASDARFGPIVERAARLICTTPEFEALWASVFPGEAMNGATDAEERARLRAELDALVARLYDLSESEFAHVLSTFPLVAEPVKLAARNKFRDLERGVWEI
jgi:hypothetical protein